MNHERTAVDSELLVAQYGWVRSVARSLVRDRWGAEDVAQETVLAALVQPPPDARDGARLRAWLGRVAFNLSHLAARQSARRQAREQRSARAEALASAADLAENAALSASIADAILGLGEPYSTTVELRYFEGLSTADIAARTGTTELAVRKRLWRARGKLRLSLGAIGAGFEAEANGHGANGRLRSGRAKQALSALLPLRWFSRARLADGIGGAKLAASLALSLGGALWFVQRSADRPREALLAPGSTASAPGLRVVSSSFAAPPASGERAPDTGSGSSREALGPGEPTLRISRSTEERTREMPEGYTLRGTVLDLGGQPLAGLSIVDPLSPRGALGTSAFDGSFVVRIAELPVSLGARGLGFGPVRSVQVERGMESGSQVLVAAPVQRITGWVVAESGLPLPGARVEITCDDSAWSHLGLPIRVDPRVDPAGAGSSDAAGRFQLEEVPLAAGFFLRTTLAGHEPDLRPTQELTPGATITLHEVPGAALVSGFVRRATGEPAPGAEVWLGLSTTRADEHGFFWLAAPRCLEGSTLEAREEGVEPARIRNFGARLRDGFPAQQVELVLGDALETISGMLVDAGDSSAEDHDGWRIGAFRLDGGEPSPVAVAPAALTCTDAQGLFEIRGLPRGTYSLLAVDPRSLRTARLGPIRSGASRLELRAEASAALQSVAGSLSTDDGSPLNGARIEVVARLDTPLGCWASPLQELRADPRGRFELTVDPQIALEIRVEHPAVDDQTVELPEHLGAIRPTLALVLPRTSYVQLADARADAVAILDAQGRELPVRGPVTSSTRFALRDGESPVLALPAGARAFRLLRGAEELACGPIQPLAGEIQRLSP